MKFAKILKHLTVAAMLMVGATSAQAVMIQGSVNIVGAADVTTPGDLIDATSITLTGAAATGTTGDFSTYMPGATLFTPFALTIPASGSEVTLDLVTPGSTLPAVIWSGGGFTFTTETLSVSNDGTFLNLFGLGSLTGNGFDTTDGYFTLSTQGGGINNGDGTYEFSFSAFTAVPESSTIALMGLGLIGLAAVRRRRA